jgi:hypothetical protein
VLFFGALGPGLLELSSALFVNFPLVKGRWARKTLKFLAAVIPALDNNTQGQAAAGIQ